MGLFDWGSDNDGPRVAVFGVDGLTHSLVTQNPEVFPNLRALAADGDAGAMSSVVPPESSATWTALTTGVNPGRTGVYGFQQRDPDSYETYVPMDHDVEAPRLWDFAQRAGRSATVMNVPVTFPPRQDVQRMVSGFLSPGVEQAARPDELRETLRAMDYRIDVDASLGHRDTEALLEDAHETLDRRHEAFEKYVVRDDWDLFVGVFMTPDRLNHFLFDDYEQGGQYGEALLNVYRRVDRHLGALRDALADDVTTVVTSDHGFTGLDYEVDLNEWLRREGWLDYRTTDPDGLADISSETRAYAMAPGRFHLNLAGREPRGSVSREDYERVRDVLARRMSDLEGPDGRAVVSRVVPGEAVYAGDHAGLAPDLVALPNPGFDLKGGRFGTDAPVFASGSRTGMHTLGNAVMLTDNSGVHVEDASLYDLVPTVLDLLDVEFDDDAFDGVSLCTPPASRRSNAVRDAVTGAAIRPEPPAERSAPDASATGHDSGGHSESQSPTTGASADGPPETSEPASNRTESRGQPTAEPGRIPTHPDASIEYGALDRQDVIGGGGNADVTLATVSTPGGEVTVAVKEPRMNGTLHSETVERLLTEAETWEKLDGHDHVVGVVDYGSEPLPWIAMEYMDGGHLGQRAGDMDTAQALWTALAITTGVRHAHRRGVAHLDLKPENVLFREVEGAWDVPKVADWGLSKQLLDHSQSVEGFSPGYAAPEQFSDDFGPADDLTDVYQLGAVCYELFTGEPPFAGDTAQAVYQVLHEEPAPPTDLADVPDGLDDVLLTALAKDREDRYDDIVYLRDAFRSLYESASE